MNIKQRAIVGVIIIVSFVFFTNREKFSNSVVTNNEINSIIVQAEKAFSDAESKVFKPDTPAPNVEPVGPNPDAAKCICKGTGKIVQGDGHVSPCPYHSGDVPDVMDDDCSKCGKTPCECSNSKQEATINNLQNNKQIIIRRGVLDRLFGR